MNNKTLTQLMIGAVAFIAGFVAGSLWTENQLLKSGTAGNGQQVGAPIAAGEKPVAADSLSEMPEVTEEDHIRGNMDAEIILVEYSDYECPYCNKFHPTMTKIMEEYGDKVAWVYRHYPLSFHARAQASAEAAECVAEAAGNDAFWKFSDMLYENAALDGAEALSEDNLITAATKSGANAAAVQKCIDDGDLAKLVTADFAGGRNAGVSGTPGTILVTQDGPQELISGALPYAQVKSIIDGYLE
ncbi:MAG: thioredoxin domain-containing protein [Candidatus Pacebacteria bacterium]|jgi:protein-disulfide isomerase|nr:thioredoxin domain-containing protein [Candidatus Paceibacterota bacterium]MBT4651979.1 thioredoxin domain-containing protein [Candidatus Paceibacterota bacterium]MBT6756001.1 thioredoxin domain-containing protein [Candidatus Paceibacterota bacterium]MBT6920811.1 thioredoxin domain-containing protein [Candidatus Paceibacterota bacterium]